MEATVRQIHENSPAKVMVGGAPVTDDYAREIGADGYAPDAYLAAHAAVELVAVAESPMTLGGDRS
jgi:5-methyltetrahydrofolate--homocysteine methyltransferase